MFNCERGSKRLAECTDLEVMESGMAVIRLMYPNAPDCKAFLRTNWTKDEFAQMSYTYIALGGS